MSDITREQWIRALRTAAGKMQDRANELAVSDEPDRAHAMDAAAEAFRSLVAALKED